MKTLFFIWLLYKKEYSGGVFILNIKFMIKLDLLKKYIWKTDDVKIHELLHIIDFLKIKIETVKLLKLWQKKLLPLSKQTPELMKYVERIFIDYDKIKNSKLEKVLNPDEFNIWDKFRYVTDNWELWVIIYVVMYNWKKCFSETSYPSDEPTQLNKYKYKNLMSV